jgi:hypothetical protein
MDVSFGQYELVLWKALVATDLPHIALGTEVKWIILELLHTDLYAQHVSTSVLVILVRIPHQGDGHI